MRDHGSWSISLGCWSGLYLRLHMFFLLFATGALYLSWLNSNQQAGGEPSLTWLVWASLGILLVSVIAHEVGHVMASIRLGGGTEEIVLWPLGGLSPVHVPPEPQAEIITALAGPLVNLVI